MTVARHKESTLRYLFDVLGVSFREDSYTSLLATIFEEPQGQEWARRYFKEACDAPVPIPEGPVRVRIRPRLRRKTRARFDVPDLVLTFGGPAQVIWLIEAKIGAQEGAEQLTNYETEGIRSSIVDALDSVHAKPVWQYSYLTLEGDEPAESAAFVPVTYEPLCDILPPETTLAAEVTPAYGCLRRRLVDYCGERRKIPDGSTSLESYLSDTWGLITEKARFH